jgi:acetyl-CoA C-acetyltransferase
MDLDPRTPVVVGAAAATEQTEDPGKGLDALGLMEVALRRAAEGAGSRALLSQVDSIWTPRGFWPHANPGRQLAERFGASAIRGSSGPRTVVADIGVLQTTVLGYAARALAEGRSEIAMIVGGESRDRDERMRRLGQAAPVASENDLEPDEVLRPGADILSRREIDLGWATPAVQYAMIDNALRHHEGQSLAEHRGELGELWADFNRVAVDNPDAWNRTPMSADAIVEANTTNRLISFPYTRSMVSQWNVNQAGGLILCTLERARRLGLDESRFVYPLAVVDAEHMLTLSERRDLHRAPGFELASARALAHAGLEIAEVDALELYSCFPAAVRIQARALGIDRRRRVNLTGGMTFGGGPLNNFAIQGWVKMIERLRGESGATGFVSAVSGFMTKQGVSVFGTEPRCAFHFDSVTRETAEAQARVRVDPDARGRARVASYTVIPVRDEAARVALLFDLDGERRALHVVQDADLAQAAMNEEFCGRGAELGEKGEIRWD